MRNNNNLHTESTDFQLCTELKADWIAKKVKTKTTKLLTHKYKIYHKYPVASSMRKYANLFYRLI